MDENLRQLLTLGKEYYVKRDYANARAYLEQVVDQTQSFADVYNMLGVIYHDMGQFSKAQKALEHSLQLNPAYTEAALNLAVLYNDLGKYAEAKEVYRQALQHSRGAVDKLDPYVAGKIANMHAEVADAYRSAGQLNRAIEEYRKAVDLRPMFVDIRTKLATALRDNGNTEDAAVECRRAIEDRSEYLPAHILLGVCYYSMGQHDQALEEWQFVLDRNPEDARAKMYVSMVKGS
ncbi:MAG: tetratricopeptide repeat protein [Myxococcota bacterium]